MFSYLIISTATLELVYNENISAFYTVSIDILSEKQTPDLLKKQTIYQNWLYELKTHFWQIRGSWFQICQ